MSTTAGGAEFARSPKPVLYNWVRASLFFARLSAVMSSAILVFATIPFVYVIDIGARTATKNGIGIALLATLLLSLLGRGLFLRAAKRSFEKDFKIDKVLGAWLLSLLLIHVQLQLLSGIAASGVLSMSLSVLCFFVAVVALIRSWPRRVQVQHLLIDAHRPRAL